VLFKWNISIAANSVYANINFKKLRSGSNREMISGRDEDEYFDIEMKQNI